MTTAFETSEHRNQPRWWSRLLPYAGMLVIALLLWLPFGFKTTGLIEEVGINEVLDNGIQLFFITPDSLLALVRTRPLQIFPFALAYTIDPNSYFGYNLLMFLFLFGKMVVTYWLVLKFLPGKKTLAFVTGVLFAIYPADSGLFAFRVIAAHFAVVSYLFAVYFMLAFWEQHRWRQWLALLGMAAALMFSIWQYQIALAACLVTPIVLLYFTRPNKRFFVTAGAWYGIIALLLAYAFWALGQSATTSHEADMLPSSITPDSIGQMLYALGIGYQRQFTGWTAALGKLPYLTYYGGYIAAGLLVIVLVGYGLLRQRRHESGENTVPAWRYAVLWLGGIAFFAVGVATFIPIPSRQLQNFRIYLVAMLGSAWVLALTLYFLSRFARRYRDVLFIVLALPFIGLALLNAMQQQQMYVNYSLQQQNILQQVIAQAPQITPDTVMVIDDNAGLMNNENVFYYGTYWSTLIRYLYKNPTMRVFYCPPEGGTIVPAGACQFEPSFLIASIITPDGTGAAPRTDITIPYDKLLIFRTEADGRTALLTTEAVQARWQISGYNPDALITQGDPPYRATTLFSCEPALSCYRPAPPVSALDLDLRQEIGTHWRSFEQAAHDDNVFRWSTHPQATINLNLNTDRDLRLEFHVLAWVVDDMTMDGLTLSVNGDELPLTVTRDEGGGRLYSTVIPQATLAKQGESSVIRLTLDHVAEIPGAVDVRLGFALDGLRIRPVD
ncbi:MAG: hypothetical protein LCI00_27510 [Chloroflexi bacterium]|nr:hypothetical protein [Chloroflexota bacterium]MCC6897239.1 hypothetical protein [Anaerolineae bacterium]